ncbi:DUF4884 domain-containing protein [Dysgonomonas sp. ZJ279]|uniref:DUF4884 domain-containing protein n=1 Tax=Dysgonomonas sp. ZJ279 TaxID=2709796 RepID=UPI0013EAEA8A|nr:DUF4884 domain-containing protein [Dysgonomonas sp. ZJ279]
MKRITLQLMTVAVAFILASCGGSALLVAPSDNNPTYTVDYLFEHDGCKVYRFYDRGNYVYFTNCTGDVTAISNDSTSTRIQTITKRK